MKWHLARTRRCTCLSAVATFLHEARSSRHHRGISKRDEDCRFPWRARCTRGDNRFFWRFTGSTFRMSWTLSRLECKLWQRVESWRFWQSRYRAGKESGQRERVEPGRRGAPEVCFLMSASTQPIAQVGSTPLLLHHANTTCLLSDINFLVSCLLPNTRTKR